MIKKTFITLITCVLLHEGLFAQGPNLATTATITAKSSSLPVNNIKDRDYSSKWQSTYSSKQWVKLELGSNKTIRFMAISLYNFKADYGFSIEVSIDDYTWSQVFTTSTSSASLFTRSHMYNCISNEFKPFRYIRITFDGFQGSSELGEVEIFEKNIIVSGFASNNNINSIYALDEKPETWASPQANVGQMTLNLSKTISNARVDLTTSVYPYTIGLYNNSTCIAPNYHTTTSQNESFYIIAPEGFNKIAISSNNFFLREFSIKEINSQGVSLNYEYNNAGQMNLRTILIASSLSEEIFPTDTIIPLEQSYEPEEESPFKDKFGDATIQIFPNPTKGMLKIVPTGIKQGKNCELKLIGIDGNVLWKNAIGVSETTIDLTNKPGGTYLLIINFDGETRQWTIIKQ